MERLRWIRSLFATNYYIISLTRDVVGLECAVALKNGYALGTALAIGMAEKAGDDGINHNNSEAALFQESVKEMLELLRIVGGKTEQIMYAAGDLSVTVAAGRSRTVGLLLGKGMPMEKVMRQLKGQTLEAVVIATRTARAVKALAKAGMNRRSNKILRELVLGNRQNVTELVEKYKVQERTIRADIKELNDALERYKLPPIMQEPDGELSALGLAFLGRCSLFSMEEISDSGKNENKP